MFIIWDNNVFAGEGMVIDGNDWSKIYYYCEGYFDWGGLTKEKTD